MIKYEVVVDDNGDKEWFLNGSRHREDGPAWELPDGSKRWYLNGKLHRTDGPAVEYSNGNKFWYLNGKCHRTDGPAMEWANGSKFWYLNDKELTEAEWREKMKPKTKKPKAPCEGRVVEVDGVRYKLMAV